MLFCNTGVEISKKDLLAEIEKLKEAIEYEKQPNISFEKESDALKSKVIIIVNSHCITVFKENT